MVHDIMVCDKIKIQKTMRKQGKTTLLKTIFRILLAIFMVYAGFSHLTFNRIDFQAQVPDWIPMSKDLVVILSGIVALA